MHTAWWQEQWRRHAHLTTPLRHRGLECDIEFGLSAYIVRVSLPDGSHLIIGPPQETSPGGPPGDPDGWIVTHQHPDDQALSEVIYDSAPSAGPGTPERPEIRHGGSIAHLIEAIDRRLAQLGMPPAPSPPTASPHMSPAKQSPAAHSLSGWVYEGSRRRWAALATTPALLPENSGDGADHQPVHHRAPGTRPPHERQLAALIDHVRADSTPLTEAAALTKQVLDPETGLLAHLGAFLDAVADRVCATGTDASFDFLDGVTDITSALHGLADDLRPLADRIQEFAAPDQHPASPPAPVPAPASPRRRPAPSDTSRNCVNPDFELYDNVGRTSEQTAAAHFGMATRDDLHRWATRDAEPFLAAHPLPDEPFPVPDLVPYRRALDAADTPAEFSAALNAVLVAVEPFLNEVAEHLVTTARWKESLRGAERGSPPRLLEGAASCVLSALGMAAEADLMLLRAHYDPPPAPDASGQRPSGSRTTPPAPPPPPGPHPPADRPRR
ncbi:hypothetical protein [Streptomyces sp. NPDC088789]|uniref:hypothetical protein n=1 Tax=Streptomyces sp. NPDC088789 TaxID=3365899 RepID=UPI00380FA2E9